MNSPASVTVIVCAFADERYDLTVACVEAASQQDPAPSQVIVVVDHNETLQQRLTARLGPGAQVTANAGPTGLSAARNTGIALATGDIVAFLDDDALPHPGWLSNLLTGFSEPAVLGVGGRAVPRWENGRPGWFPATFLWTVGCSYAGQPDVGPVRNPLGCNMAFRREVFDRAGLFDTQIGRLGSRPLGCEETELCIRAARELSGGTFVLVPGADIDHWVPLTRANPRYFLRRCYYEGISKALVRLLGDTRSLDTERSYVSRTLPAATLRAVARALIGPTRADAAGEAALIIGGLAAAALGYVRGAVTFARRPPQALLERSGAGRR